MADREKEQLRDALEDQTEALETVQDALVEALPPDSGKIADDVIDEIWPVADPGEALEKGKKVLADTEQGTEDPPTAANDEAEEGRSAG